MITDNNNANGVPNGNAFKTQGLSQRTQLIKPNQVNNTGRTAPSYNANSNASSNANTSMFRPAQSTPAQMQNTTNPLRARASLSPTAQNPTQIRPTASAGTGQYYNNSYGFSPNGVAGGGMSSTTSSLLTTSQPTPPTNVGNARSAIRNLSDNEIVSLLDEIANGTLTGRGAI